MNPCRRCSTYRGLYTLQQADGTYPGSLFSSLAHAFVGVCGWKHFLIWLLPVRMLKCCHSCCAACGFPRHKCHGGAVSRAVSHAGQCVKTLYRSGCCKVVRGSRGACAILLHQAHDWAVWELAATAGLQNKRAVQTDSAFWDPSSRTENNCEAFASTAAILGLKSLKLLKLSFKPKGQIKNKHRELSCIPPVQD